MTRFRRPVQKVGRSEHLLRMPYPGNTTPEGVAANFRELERWGNDLPLPHRDSFVPYFIEYAPADPQEEWDVDLIEILHSTYGIDYTPTGTWLVHAGLGRIGLPPPEGTVGVRGSLLVLGQNYRPSIIAASTVGFFEPYEAIKTVDDINFVDSEVTYKWDLPKSSFSTGEGVLVQSTNVLYVYAADDPLTIQGGMQSSSIIDPDVSGELQTLPLSGHLYAWALRLTDRYSMPGDLEDITPD